MKKYFLLLCISLGGYSTYAQFEEGQSAINIGLGLNSFYVSGSGFSTTIPPLEGSIEFFIEEKISVGGLIGLYGSKYEIEEEFSDGSDYYIGNKYNYFTIGGFGNYHFVNDEQWNFYAGLKILYASVSVKQHIDMYPSDPVLESSLLNAIDARASGIIPSISIGARYHLSDGIALNAELGYGIALLKVGVTFKL